MQPLPILSALLGTPESPVIHSRFRPILAPRERKVMQRVLTLSPFMGSTTNVGVVWLFRPPSLGPPRRRG